MKRNKYLEVPGFADRTEVINIILQICKDGSNQSKSTTWFLGVKSRDFYRELFISNSTHKPLHAVEITVNTQQFGMTAYAPRANYGFIPSLSGGFIYNSPILLNSISFSRGPQKR